MKLGSEPTAQRFSRRDLLRVAGALATASTVPGCASTNARPAGGAVVVVGGGYGGATVAKYIRMWSEGRVEVTLVESATAFVSCPLSNLVLGGSKEIADLTVAYDNLASRHGVRVIRGTAVGVDPDRRTLTLADGAVLPWDRLILSPGIEFIWDEVPALVDPAAQATILHAWKAGPQTAGLRKQLEAMPDGGTCVISIPRAPFRCPPGPYERACQIAWYFKRAKPRSKVLVLDGNEDVLSKKALFVKAWAEEYKGLVEYRPNYVLTDVDVRTQTAKFETQDDVRATVLNVIPPQRAGAVARAAGVVTANDRWCEVDFLSYESISVRNVHVLGDAIQVAPLMPKSGHMANQQAKVCAAAVVALLSERAPNPSPVLTNTCYSFITDREVVHVSSVHQYDRQARTMLTVAGSGGLSPAMGEPEGRYAFAWAKNIWADALA